MKFELLGKEGAPSLMLIPGLGVSYEIFLPLVELLKDKFRIIAVQVDGYKSVIPTNRSLSTGRTSISGTGRRKPSWPSRRWNTCRSSVRNFT